MFCNFTRLPKEGMSRNEVKSSEGFRTWNFVIEVMLIVRVIAKLSFCLLVSVLQHYLIGIFFVAKSYQ